MSDNDLKFDDELLTRIALSDATVLVAHSFRATKSCNTAIPVNCFVSEPMLNLESTTLGTCHATSANPYALRSFTSLAFCHVGCRHGATRLRNSGRGVKSLIRQKSLAGGVVQPRALMKPNPPSAGTY